MRRKTIYWVSIMRTSFALAAILAASFAVPAIAAPAQTALRPTVEATSPAETSRETARYVATALTTSRFIVAASALAITHSASLRVQAYARDAVKEYENLSGSTVAWALDNAPVIAGRSVGLPTPRNAVEGVATLAFAPLAVLVTTGMAITGTLPAQTDDGRTISATQAATLEKLSQLRGWDFDLAYIEAMNDSVRSLAGASSTYLQQGNDGVLKRSVLASMPILRRDMTRLRDL